jgi:predicted RNA-binding Zn ribbon-like protein
MEALCLQLLNSERYDYRGNGQLIEDQLYQPGWLEALLKRWDLTLEHASPQEGLHILSVLRSRLRTLVECLNRGQDLSEKDLALLNDALNAVPRRRLLIRNGNMYTRQEEPLRKDWLWVEAEIVASFVALLEHDPLRIKICENPHCRWIYYDESPNHTRRWCEDTCANMMRVRRFREKKRSHDSSPPPIH